MAKSELNPRQEKFCLVYATDQEFFGNGVQSYIEVYKPDQTKPNWYNVACARASELLSSPKVFTRINELLQETGFSEVAVDKQLSFLIHQQADFKSKLGAIQEFNKLKARIQSKLDVTTGGKPIPILGYVSKDNSNRQNNEDDKTSTGNTGGDVGQQDNLNPSVLDSLSTN